MRLGWGHALAGAVVIAVIAATPASGAYVFASKWGSRGTGDGQFNQPRDVAVAPDGSVYVADSINNRVQRFAPDGTFASKLAGFSSPFGVDVDGAGNLYVADRNNHRVQKFGPDGTLLATFGSFGAGDGQFNAPVDVAVDPAGNLFVLDYSNYRVQRLAPDGSFVTKWGSRGSGDSQFDAPSHIAVDAAGGVYVTDPTTHRVQKFDSSGTLITKWGALGTADGQFNSVAGIDVDSAGNVLAVDTNNRRVEKFTPAGVFLAKFGSAGTADGEFTRPIAVATHPGNGVYVADIGAHQIQRFTELPDGTGGPPPPVVGKTANLQVVRGTVTFTPKGSTKPQPLSATTQIPMGSTVNTSKGTVRMTTASDAKGLTQTGDFYNGIFKVSQKRSSKPITQLQLMGGSFRSCRGSRGASAAASPKRVRRLWGNARGRYRSVGRYSSATVRGTIWLTEDRCDGTLTRVRKGQVVVRDLVRKRNVKLKAGKSYLARPRG
jgi:sugar lactone lactonase YvrE